MNLIKKNWGVLVLVAFLLIFIGNKLYLNYKLRNYYSSPQSGDIYLFEFESDHFAPYYLDRFAHDSFYFFVHPYDFTGKIPSQDEVMVDSFLSNTYHIYSKNSLDDFFESDKLNVIYREED